MRFEPTHGVVSQLGLRLATTSGCDVVLIGDRDFRGTKGGCMSSSRLLVRSIVSSHRGAAENVVPLLKFLDLGRRHEVDWRVGLERIAQGRAPASVAGDDNPPATMVWSGLGSWRRPSHDSLLFISSYCN